MNWYLTLLILIVCINSISVHATMTNLRTLTINVWSGLDYESFFKFGEFENKQRRELRYRLLLQQIRELNPVIIFVQEANWASRYPKRLANDLDFTEIHQVVNAGIKFGPVGLPTNLKEGLVILARPSLKLKKIDAWKLSGSPGIHANYLTMHFDESVLTLVGKIMVQ